ncbi:PepSY domain-containing protein [Secundilactobacillus oryzae]|uniref:PepSY domain-containing protein n=1 Tax=Secundilactobacillus oryzae TaxID=1202668 RepID=UPI0006D19E0B|nr:PepSY domain-containing protein [Secundilactobacillus oryzae]
MKKPLIMMVTAVGLLLAGCSSNNQHPQDSSSQSSETSTASSSTKTKLQDAQDVSISLIQAVDKVNAEQENARLTSVELSNDAGGYVYEIETVTTNREFKYTVDAESGKLDETKNERLEADDRSESDAERFTLNNVRSVQKNG